MKKFLSTAIVFTASTFLLSSIAFGACPINKVNTACKIGTPTGAAAPVSYIVAPVNQRTYLKPCTNCEKQTKQNIFQKTIKPFTGIYNSIIGPFTNLY